MPSQMRLLALPPCPAPLCGGRLSPETTLPGCSAPKNPGPSTTAPQSESSSDEESESFVRLRAGLAAASYVAPQLSILESLVLDRFWDAVASAYPRWLAPNLVTLGGGACVAAAAALTLAHSPALGGAAPRWVYACNAALLFAYQTLDGSDGKQARRTGSGSPLGEFVDHGVDAWAVAPVLFVAIDGFGFGLRSAWPWALLLGAQASFYLSNLTLVATGRMDVHRVDVIELQAAMVAAQLVTAFNPLGPALWSSPLAPLLPAGLRAALPAAVPPLLLVREALGVVIAGGMAASVAEAVWRLVGGSAAPARTSTRDDGAEGAERRRLGPPLRLLAAHAALALGGVAACRRSGASADRSLRLLFGCAGCSFATLGARLLMLRIGRRPLPPPRACPELACLAAFVGVRAFGGGGRGAAAALAATAAATAATHLLYVGAAGRDTARALGISPWRVKGARLEA